MFSDKQIESAKTRIKYSPDIRHEHPDCIRIAYEWLDAQKKIKGFNKNHRALKHMIERWAARYVSQADVEVAALLHNGVFGTYPYYNISQKLTLPNSRRLWGIPEANTQMSYRNSFDEKDYSLREA